MNFFRNDLKQSVADSVNKTDNRISFDIDRDSIQLGTTETANYAATPALISGTATTTSQNQMLGNQAQYASTMPEAVRANLADSIVITQSNLANWGIGEGVGTGEIPDYLPTNSCTCGNCSQCNGGTTNGFNPLAATTTLVDLDQVVYLEFDSGTDGNINYTSDIRAAIVEQMTLIYENFGVEFVLEPPTEGDFSTLFFNAGTSGGLAEDIDFRNLNKNDNAVINIVGFGVIDSDAEIISASANIGAHELGHILGLRHHDAFGPIGSGIPDNLFFPGFAPAFTGPTNADETRNHILNTPALAGTVGDVLTRSWLGEREAIKLAFSVLGTTVAESTAPNDSFQTAQAIDLDEIIVPNTIIVGDNADAGDFNVEAVSVVGSFSFVDSQDFYSFEGVEGRFYSFEVISNATNRYANNDPIDPVISIYDSAFNLVDYYDSPAVNDDDVEFSFDSHILDLFLPENGTYFVEIDTFSNGDSGNYELFIQNVVAQPFVLDQPDDHSDIVLNETATRLEFEPVSNNVIAREEGIIGFIDTPVEQDVFSFTIDTSAKVIVDVRATFNFFNSFVTLLDSNQNQIAFNDDSSNPSLENATDSQFIVNDLPAGDYFVVVEGSNESTGSYRLGVRHNGAAGNFDDHADSFIGSTVLSLNSLPQTTFVNASAELGSDNDYFRFTAQTTGRMVVRSLGLSGDINTVLRAYNSDTDLIDANNNFNGSLDSRVAFNIIEGETYFVRLSTVQETSGDYRLSLRSIEGESVASTNNGATNGLTLDQNQGSIYEKYIDLHFGQSNTNDYGAAFDAFLATSDLPIRQIDEFDGDRGLLAVNV